MEQVVMCNGMHLVIRGLKERLGLKEFGDFFIKASNCNWDVEVIAKKLRAMTDNRDIKVVRS